MARHHRHDLRRPKRPSNIFITGLQNAHALEKQAIQLMERQLERIENYPEVEQLLRSTSARPKSRSAGSTRSCTPSARTARS